MTPAAAAIPRSHPVKPVVIKWGGSGFAEVTSFGGGVFRARIGHGRKTGEYPSYAIVNRPQPTGEVASPRGGAKVLASSDGWLLEVRANPKGGTLGLRLVDPDGVTVFSTAGPVGGSLAQPQGRLEPAV